MSSPIQFIEDAVAAAKRAVQFDSEGKQEPAAYFYRVSAKLLTRAAELSEPDKVETLHQKAIEYSNRAAVLEELAKEGAKPDVEDPMKQRLQRCHFLLQQALDADVEGLKDVAVDLYTNAIEYVTKHPELMRGELKELIMEALERAEHLKG